MKPTPSAFFLSRGYPVYPLALWACICWPAGSAWAQNNTIPQPSAPTPYQDRVIEGLPEQDPEALAQDNIDKSGLPRGYSLETLWNQQKTQQGTTLAQGLKLRGYTDTLVWGSLSAQVDLQRDSNGQGTSTNYILRQTGMPFDGGWRADNALGMVNLPVPDLARSSLRVLLPTPAMRGLSSIWKQADNLTLLAGWGQAGRFTGYQTPSFDVADGHYALVGVQGKELSNNGQWEWSGAAAKARNVRSAFANPLGAGLVDAQGLYGSARREWTTGGNSAPTKSVNTLQINALYGNNSGSNNGSGVSGQANAPASGVWIDGSQTQGAQQDNWGLFWLEPSLGWLDNPLVSDVNGGYWRHVWRTRQWSMESGVELLGSVSGQTPQGFFATHSARYQYSTASSFGGTVNLRRFGGQSQSALVYAQFGNGLGNSRLQFEAGSADTGERQTRMQLDHDWSFITSMRLSTTLSAERNQSLTNTNRVLGLAASADWQWGSQLSLNSSVQSRWVDGVAQYALATGVGWKIAQRWSLLANLYATQGNAQGSTSLAQSPLSAAATPLVRTNDRGIFVSLRYEARAGTNTAPVGGTVGSAAGQLSGSVFLDANKNNKRDAAERGAANVTVILDGRYGVQTDAQGRFDFSYVAAGPHVITVVSDNLPLPWSLDNNGRTEVKVFTRDLTKIDIGAVQP